MERLIKDTECTAMWRSEEKSVRGRERESQREREANSLADVSNLGCGTVQSSFAGEKSRGS